MKISVKKSWKKINDYWWVDINLGVSFSPHAWIIHLILFYIYIDRKPLDKEDK